MLITYAFNDTVYIPLITLLNKVLKKALDEDLFDYIHYDLCFYYRGKMYYQDKEVSLEGVIEPEPDLRTFNHIQAALHFAKLNYGSNFFNTAKNTKISEDAYTIGGVIRATSAKINNSDTRYIGQGELYLPNSVLPYYLIKVDMLHEYEYDGYLEKGTSKLITEQSTQKPAYHLPVKLGESLGTPLNPSSKILKLRLSQLQEENEHLNREVKHRIGHVGDYREFLTKSQQENTELREQLNALLAELASRSPKPEKNDRQAQREAILEKLLCGMEKQATERAKKEEHFSFNRGFIRATKEDMQKALQHLENKETGRNILFFIAPSSFDDFWKKQSLCRLSRGREQNIDAALLHI